MSDLITIYIDNKKIKCKKDARVLQVALDNDIDIPHFCYHEDLNIDANCRACLVYDKQADKITTSCTLKAYEGLQVITDSTKVKQLRNQNMELLLASYKDNSITVKKGYYSKALEIMKKHGITGDKYKKIKVDRETKEMGPAIFIDPQVCIACNKCVKVCNNMGIGCLEITGKGAGTHVSQTKNPDIDCINCGQCTLYCPVNAIREQYNIEDVQDAINDSNKIVIAQMAPSVRASIGEEFNIPVGQNVTKQMNTALKQLGFDYVFDVNMGADITTIVEAKELKDRIVSNGVLPMFTSCCPAWVKYVEFYYPEMLPHLTTSRSPQIHSGGIYKTWWAEKNNIDPNDIVVVSIMPCTSKKYEASLKKLLIDDNKPVDYVLTVRETAIMMKKNNIKLPDLEDTEVDPLGNYSGAAAIYGASGGVMESALRTAHYYITGEELAKVEFHEVRGMQGIKKATIKIGDLDVNVAVVATPKHMKLIIEEVKKDPNKYHYIEVMACPGGCIGGGGQPIPSSKKIIKERTKCLYDIDTKKTLRKAHQNPIVKELFETYLDKLPHKRQEKILHTHYQKRKKSK